MLDFFMGLEDPRDKRGLVYELRSIVFITLAGVLSGCDDYEEIAEFGKQRREWISQFVTLPEGRNISHDAFTDFYSALDPKKFADCFLNWTASVCNLTKEDVVAIDGKRVRGSYDNFTSTEAIHIVSAYATNAGIALAQEKVDTKSNEITAIPKLLEVLQLNGASVTIDAMGCQTAIAEKIISQGGQYLLAVKGNQGKLYDDIQYSFKNLNVIDFDKTVEKSHGRIEERVCEVIKDLTMIEQHEKWDSLSTLVRISTRREDVISKKISEENRYYISSHNESAANFNAMIRGHWGIENKVHWMLDVVYNEDYSRTRIGNGAENLSILRRISLNVLNLDQTSKKSQKVKRKTASWNLNYLQQLMKIDFF